MFCEQTTPSGHLEDRAFVNQPPRQTRCGKSVASDTTFIELCLGWVEDPEKVPELIRKYGDRVAQVIIGGGDGTEQEMRLLQD